MVALTLHIRDVYGGEVGNTCFVFARCVAVRLVSLIDLLRIHEIHVHVSATTSTVLDDLSSSSVRYTKFQGSTSVRPRPLLSTSLSIRFALASLPFDELLTTNSR